jgi:hypothetical protein
VDYSPAAVTQRLQSMSALSDLRSERRLWAKIDYSPAAVTARLRQQSMLRRACLRFRRGADVSGTSPAAEAS